MSRFLSRRSTFRVRQACDLGHPCTYGVVSNCRAQKSRSRASVVVYLILIQYGQTLLSPQGLAKPSRLPIINGKPVRYECPFHPAGAMLATRTASSHAAWPSRFPGMRILGRLPERSPYASNGILPIAPLDDRFACPEGHTHDARLNIEL